MEVKGHLSFCYVLLAQVITFDTVLLGLGLFNKFYVTTRYGSLCDVTMAVGDVTIAGDDVAESCLEEKKFVESEEEDVDGDVLQTLSTLKDTDV